jgi:hypothetical protein
MGRAKQEHSPSATGGSGMSAVPNPFYHRDAITKPKYFYGRKQELSQIWDMLYNTQSCSIVGERKIGKSSLLHYLADKQNREQVGLSPEKFWMIHFDFQGKRYLSPLQFWKLCFRRLSSEYESPELRYYADDLGEMSEIPFYEIDEWFFANFKGEKKLCFLFDEFEYAARGENLDANFFGGLRSLATNYNVAFVTATQVSLLDLHYSDALVDSPFFNIFVEIRLGPFADKEEALSFVHGSLEGTPISFSAEDELFLFNLAGCFPFFLQIACYYLFMSYASGASLSPVERHEKVEESFEKESRPHFKYYWSHCSDAEKAALAIPAFVGSKGKRRLKLKEIPEALAPALRGLVARGLISHEDDDYRIFSSTFANWIVSEISYIAEEKKVEDFDAWLESVEVKQLGTAVKNLAKQSQSIFLKINSSYWIVLGKLIADVRNLDSLSAFFDALGKSLK